MMGIWDPTKCSNDLPYICESEIKDCPTFDGWFVFDTQCLYVTPNSSSWAEARSTCKRLGADLSFMKTPYSENHLLLSNGVTARVWIGLKYYSSHSKYTWLDGSHFNKLQNNAVFPSNGCGTISINETTGKVEIRGYPCNTQLQGLCEKAINRELPTPASTSKNVYTSISPETRGTTAMIVPTERFPGFHETLYSTTVSQSTTILQEEPGALVHLVECLTDLNDEYVNDCIRDIFLSFDSLCNPDYHRPYDNNAGRAELYTNQFYKRFVEHFESFVEKNMTFSLCQQTRMNSFLIVERILLQTYLLSNISVNESLHFISQMIELRLRYLVSDLASKNTLPFESQITGCLVNQIRPVTTSGDIDIVFAVINNEEILEVETDKSFSVQFVQYYLVSPVLIICAFQDGRKTSVGHTFIMTYHTASDIAKERHLNITQHEVVCAFYDTTRKVWSSAGCDVLDIDLFTVKCTCNHTTSFGIIMKVHMYQISKEDEVALSIITYIGCSISIVTMFIALTVFTCIRSLNSERVFVHRNLCIAILCSQVLFLAAGKATRHKMVCRITALVLHYCFLSIFAWMLVEGLHLYTKVVQVFGTDNARNTYYLCFGWGLPLVLVIISSVADWEGYGTETSCWLSIDRKTIWAFIGPAIAVIVVNLVILIMVLRVVIKKTDRNSKKDQMRAAIKAALFLLHLLGLTWIFGLLAVNRRLIVFEYIFATSNSLQGFFVFLFHCALNTEVRQALRRVRDRRAILNENINTVSMSTSGSDSSSLAVEGTFRFRLSYNGGYNAAISTREAQLQMP
ncbi:adhesion G protein-coupled receptor L4-like [Ruditapes philippinarum]|uniref:adhesion G protein-coupled receptor L4-like n=1 Tax=Ruditapes philippinarum TaxID=129788 RepID=UPI00295BB0F4|nr:adhesion G protein-coupled receptor L4-like [Ruditapes philippinarum]